MHLSAPIRVLLADDLPELRTLLRTTLQGRGFQLVGEAADGHEALRLAADTEPDVVVLDLGMPGSDGPAMVAELRRRVPAARVVALAAFAGEALRQAALDRGAHACLDKDVDPDRLVATLREVCGRSFGPLALPPPDGLDGLASDELERVWSTLAAAPVATAVVGPDGRFLRVNPALCALVGHPEGACWPPATSSSSAAGESTGRRSRCSATPGWPPAAAASPSTWTPTAAPATWSGSWSTCARAATPRTSWPGGPPTTPSPGCPTAACSWTGWR
jgi:CheY-like chemotaxis protein